ncbi:MAG: carboxypeptidase regulatory-like domain-containing protein [Acidobacteria bacterium]|nr:carboxypeptidase regulatory-like domain-containing protein [Acidobacteriota bacterium]
MTGLLIFAATLSSRVAAQQMTGSLTGVLTDTHSAPLENVSITLRNLLTGSVIEDKTSRGGRYSFHGLAGGEYILAATGPQGSGEVGGIVVSTGHESHVQAAIELSRTQTSDAVLELASIKDSVPAPRGIGVLATASRQIPISPGRVELEASIPFDSLTMVPLAGSERSLSRSVLNLSGLALVPISPSHVFAALEPVSLAALQDSALLSRLPPEIAADSIRLDTLQHDPERLDALELESLPAAADSASFMIDDRRTNVAADEKDEGIRADRRLAFGNLHMHSPFSGAMRNHSSEFLAGPSAIKALEREVNEGTRNWNGADVSIETRRGTEHLHGQVSLFSRQRLLAAQNSSTQWVHESASGSALTVPTFTGEPFTPSDIQMRWGAGLGGELRRSHLFWFGAVDGSERNGAAVSTVRHPDRFFAQPANDQMQLLSAQLGLSGVDQASQAMNAYTKLLESLAGLLGPAARSSHQLSGFGRLDWNAGERHRFTMQGNIQRTNSPGGGFARTWQTYGAHSLGSIHAANDWLLGRWDTFATSKMLMSTQLSFGRHVRSSEPETPSAFEQSLNASAWGVLPQIVVDSRDGFTIGNPARLGRGKYPDEGIYSLLQQVKWAHGNVLLNLGGELSHEIDRTTRLRNQTGTYYYSSIEDFASDALAFSAFGLNGELNPLDQHNCDQRGKPWRDAAGVLHGLGYLPCYSYYSQAIGPSDWSLSTNDWQGYATSQWQPRKDAVFTLGMRWELEQLPAPIGKLDNPDLPLTQILPSLGAEWGPHAGFAWGLGESRWPVLRLGYGMYFARTPNAAILSAVTQTGSANGDLKFLLRPTDNLNEGGAPPFPYVLMGAPGKAVKPAAVEFAESFHNAEVHQAELSLAETLPGRIHLEATGVVSLGRRLPVTEDANIDSAVNPRTITYAVVDSSGSGPIKAPLLTVPFFASWPSAESIAGGRMNANYQQVSEIFSRANSTYEALIVRLSRNARGLAFRGRYTFGHASDWNPDESLQIDGPSVLDPNDFCQEYGASDLDVRHMVMATTVLQPKWKLHGGLGSVANGWMLSGIGHFSSGLPFTMRTTGSLVKEFNVSGQAIIGLSTGMNGYGGDNRVYGVGRNTYRYPATWKADLRMAKRFDLGQMRQLELLAESFNLFNHQNVTQIETVGYSIEPGTLNGSMPRLSFLTGLKSGQSEFGKPLNTNATDLYRPRQVQFGARMRF